MVASGAAGRPAGAGPAARAHLGSTPPGLAALFERLPGRRAPRRPGLAKGLTGGRMSSERGRMVTMRSLDATDARILQALDTDPDATVVALAERLGMSRNTVQARLRRMRDSGALGAYSRRVEPAALGYPLMAFMTLSLSQRQGDLAAQQIVRIPDVVEILATTGDGDLLVRIVAKDTAD